MIQYPRPLCPGDTIAVTAPSFGVGVNGHARLDIVIEHLRSQGYQVIEGNCVRGNRKGASAPAEERAAELMRFLSDDQISAVFPPCGGELAIQILPFLDFEKLATLPPKWMLGFSDISTILTPLTLLSGWATAHGPNLMGLPPNQTDPLTLKAMCVLQTKSGSTIEQYSSALHQVPDYTTIPISYLSTETTWKVFGAKPATEVRMKGRLIGGCLDRITRLAGTKYGNIPAFVTENKMDGVILYLENGGLRPGELARAMMGIKMNGWFDSLAGVLVGRNSGQDAGSDEELSYLDVLRSTLSGLSCPILVDVDIGHMAPQLTLINGAVAEVAVVNGAAVISQEFS